MTVTVGLQELFSFPAVSWRFVKAVGDKDAEVALMTAGDHKKRIEWAQKVVLAAANAGLAIDHDGYVARLRLLPPTVRAALAR